jgi:hypothetical protein
MIGSGLFCPVAVSRRPGEIAVFGRGATGELLYREYASGRWSELHSLGVPVARREGSGLAAPADWQVAACSGDPRRIDVFARSPDGDLLHMTASEGAWGTFTCLGAPATTSRAIAVPLGLVGPPAACAAGPERVDVFAVGQTGELLHTWWDGKSWSGFDSLGVPGLQVAGTQRSVPLAGPLAACRCGVDRIGVFVRGSRGDLMMNWWDGTRWSEFVSLGSPEVPDETYPAVTVAAPLIGPPAACSWGAHRMDVFARGSSGDIVHRLWDGRDWSPFASLGMPVTADAEPEPLSSTGAVAACTWGVNRLDVFTRAVDGNLYHAWWDGTWEHD